MREICFPYNNNIEEQKIFCFIPYVRNFFLPLLWLVTLQFMEKYLVITENHFDTRNFLTIPWNNYLKFPEHLIFCKIYKTFLDTQNKILHPKV